MLVVLLSVYAVGNSLSRVSATSTSFSGIEVPVVITIDAEFPYKPEDTHRILNILDKYDAHATFFFLGLYAEARPDIVKEVFDRGQEVACQTYSHPALRTLSYKEQYNDIKLGIELVEKATGQLPYGFAAPYFSYNNETMMAIRRLGFVYDRSILPPPPQAPFVFNNSFFELPVSEATGYFTNGTSLLMADATLIQQLGFNEKQVLDVWKFVLNQRVAMKMPLIINLHEFLSGEERWARVLDDFMAYAKSKNVIFMSAIELVNWWFRGTSAQIKRTVTTSPIDSALGINVHLRLLRGTLKNVTIVENVNGIGEIESIDGSVDGRKITWHFHEIKNDLDLYYVYKPTIIQIMRSESTLRFSNLTLSSQVPLETSLTASNIVTPIRTVSQLWLFVPNTLFWLMVLSSIIMPLAIFTILWRINKIVTVVIWILIASSSTLAFLPRNIVLVSVGLSLIISAIFYAAVFSASYGRKQ